MTKPMPKGYRSPFAYMYAPSPTVCVVDGCERDATSGDYCGGHAQRIRRTGTPGPAQLRTYHRREAR
jgi:hypothetical protein